MTKLSDYPLSAPNVLCVHFGPELNAVWNASASKEQLCLIEYDALTHQLHEIWSKEVPKDHRWDSRILLFDNNMLFQSSPDKASLYRYDDLDLVQQLDTPGKLYGLTAGGLAVMGNYVSPSSITEGGLRLHVAPPMDPMNFDNTLEIPPIGPYRREDEIVASGTHDGHTVVHNRTRKCTDLYSPEGE